MRNVKLFNLTKKTQMKQKCLNLMKQRAVVLKLNYVSNDYMT